MVLAPNAKGLLRSGVVLNVKDLCRKFFSEFSNWQELQDKIETFL